MQSYAALRPSSALHILAAIRLPLRLLLLFTLVVLPLPYLYFLLHFLDDLFTCNECLLPMR